MALIDTHTHLDSFERAGTLPATLARARAAGLEAMITIGTSPEDWALYRDLAKAEAPSIHYTVGIHPCSVDAQWPAAMAQAEGFWWAGGPRPMAVGEIGLDRFHLPKEPPAAEVLFALQRSAFAAGLALAKRLGCPIVIHSRGAFRECVEMIDASGIDWRRVVFHCFSEGPAEMAELNRRGGVGSFTGILTYKNAAAVRAAAKAQGLDRCMLETDAPYLAPMPHRGKPNEPAYLRETAEFAAGEVFGISYEDLAKVSTANARRFFGL